MSTQINDGDPAFPGFQYTEGYGPAKRNANGEWECYSSGMSLRMWLAGQSITSEAAIWQVTDRKISAEYLAIPLADYTPDVHYPILIARRCLAIADALIAENNRAIKGEPPETL